MILKRMLKSSFSLLVQQPEVDIHKISLLGHSEGSTIVPRIAIDYPNNIQNIVLMGAGAQNYSKVVSYQPLLLLEYAREILDKNKDNLVSFQESSVYPLGRMLFLDIYENLKENIKSESNIQDNNSNINNNTFLDISKEIEPFLINQTKPPSFTTSKCDDLDNCPILVKSVINQPSVLSLIDKVLPNIRILILQGENDSITPVGQALLLQQKLTQY